MQPAVNPYQSPNAAVADDEQEEYSEIKVLSASGRLGRVRYLGYGVGVSLLAYLGMALVAGISAVAHVPGLGPLTFAVGALAIVVVNVLLTIQRCHDFNTSGWLALLLIVPLAPLLFLLIPGTQGANRYGDPPPPNSSGAVALALIVPIISIVGILAAIAIPAYSDYTHRAQAAKAQQR
jgi:uncharacterized membrane protein YhaH (DUF805 family)